MRPNLEQYAILLAEAASVRSEDPFLKVGCALIRHDKTVAAVGYNGPPSMININWDDRDERRKKIVHAEANALRYVHPDEVMFAATTYMPCLECVRALASYGVKFVIYKNELPQEYHDRDAILALATEFNINIKQVTE